MVTVGFVHLREKQVSIRQVLHLQSFFSFIILIQRCVS